ncbi:MAG: tRNA(Met) cytidine acetyltransferase, partial [Gammaproteobacteria bacterium]
PGCRTADQARAVEAVLAAARGPRRRPAVLVSHRGRGKSAAFGLAAARLLAEGREVLLTGPSLEAVAPVLAMARRELERLGVPLRRLGRGALAADLPGGGRLRFLPPDRLAAPEGALGEEAPREAGGHLLLVDEAAACPQPLLERLLERHPRLAFATTVHGYEGTGRGFALRFRALLEARCRGLRWVRLEEPVRWGPGDPLEAFLDRALLLDAEPAPAAAWAAGPAPQAPRRADRDALAREEGRLRQAFGLLVEAHYRTRPLDLRHLLDGPNLALWLLEGGAGPAVAGVALAAEEGGFGPEEAQAVAEGRRRPHGHLLPESLAAHLGLEEAPRLRMLRVVRLAVHPALRRRGLGRRLVATLAEEARRRGLDLLGAAFAADPALLAFWARCGLVPVRLSLRPSAVSGRRSALVLGAVSPAGAELLEAAREALARRLPHQLADPLQDLEPELALALLAARPRRPVRLRPELWREVAAFAFGRRVYEEALHAAWALAVQALGRPEPALAPGEAAALVLRLLQRRPWAACARALGVAGRPQVQALLRAGLRALHLAHAPPELAREALALEARCRGEGPP